MLKLSKEYRKIKRKNKLNLDKQLEEHLGQQMEVARIKLQEEQQPKLKELKND